MPNNIENFLDLSIESDIIAQPTMPFFHSCDAFHLPSILNRRELTPTTCNVFSGEDLLYFFYGRPAYKSNLILDNGLSYFMPVCFILKPTAIASIKRVFPFDSGGFSQYSNFTHPKMKIEDFSLSPNVDSIGKAVNFFYGDNKKYFDGIAKKDISYDPMDFSIEAYHHLINEKGKGAGDDRKNTFEVQCNNSLPLTKDTLEAIIVPENFLTSKYLRDFQEEVSMEVITIQNYGVASGRYYVNVLDKSRDYLIKQNYL